MMNILSMSVLIQFIGRSFRNSKLHLMWPYYYVVVYDYFCILLKTNINFWFSVFFLISLKHWFYLLSGILNVLDLFHRSSLSGYMKSIFVFPYYWGYI